MVIMNQKILFNNGKHINPEVITSSINKFKRYNPTVRKIIANTNKAKLDKRLFEINVATLLNNFGMARSGPFQGIKIDNRGNITGPKNILQSCWNAIENELLEVNSLLVKNKIEPRTRTLRLIDNPTRERIITFIWQAFKKLLPICMGKSSYGLIGASKILFSVFPEIVLPVDNAEWLYVFKTVDLGEVIRIMTDEIIAWEKSAGSHLDMCDTEESNNQMKLTLPAIYNVMAMKARPKKNSIAI